MPVTCKAVSTIDSVKPLSHSNYVMTCSNSSVNIWSTKIGLYLAAGYNFKKQAKQVDGSKTTCSLYWQQFAKVVDKDGVTIMVRKKLQSAYQEKPKNVEEEKKSELVPTEEEKNSEAVPDEPKKKSANGSDQENAVDNDLLEDNELNCEKAPDDIKNGHHAYVENKLQADVNNEGWKTICFVILGSTDFFIMRTNLYFFTKILII